MFLLLNTVPSVRIIFLQAPRIISSSDLVLFSLRAFFELIAATDSRLDFIIGLAIIFSKLISQFSNRFIHFIAVKNKKKEQKYYYFLLKSSMVNENSTLLFRVFEESAIEKKMKTE